MTVKVRPYRRGGWEVDLRVVLPDGSEFRERRKSPLTSREGSRRWGEARERELVRRGFRPRRNVKTLGGFAEMYLEYMASNRCKPSYIDAHRKLIAAHLSPLLGQVRLDAIDQPAVERLKARLSGRAASTTNNALICLSAVLRAAVALGELGEAPCVIKHVRSVEADEVAFYDVADYARLVSAAREQDPRTHLVVLLGGRAGLRSGEMIALRWDRVDFRRRQIAVTSSSWRGVETAAKSRRKRIIPLAQSLLDALRAHQHLRSRYVLCSEDGAPIGYYKMRGLIRRACKLAGVEFRGVHVLRHTCCSHLAMAGVPVRVIQEIAGHRQLATTQRYMHLSPSRVDDGIRVMDALGDAWETQSTESCKSC